MGQHTQTERAGRRALLSCKSAVQRLSSSVCVYWRGWKSKRQYYKVVLNHFGLVKISHPRLEISSTSMLAWHAPHLRLNPNITQSHTSNPRTQELEAGGSGVRGLPQYIVSTRPAPDTQDPKLNKVLSPSLWYRLKKKPTSSLSQMPKYNRSTFADLMCLIGYPNHRPHPSACAFCKSANYQSPQGTDLLW